MSYTEEQIQQTRAMVLLGTFGVTSYPPEHWERWQYAETAYAPEWLSESELVCDPDRCVTVLDYSLSAPEPPAGYRLAYQYAAGEKECPDCEDSYQDEDSIKREDCKLCDGSGYIFDGEECQVCIFAPLLYTYGSGEPGCLYDSGPDQADTLEDAIEALCFRFDGCVGLFTLERMRRTLREQGGGCYYFDWRIRPFAGASYVEISGPN